jgi:electron transfer flavoprotein beta subunit
MRAIVCVKRVPDTEARIRIRPDGAGIDQTGVKFVTNPYDEFALEAALQQRDAAGEGEVTVISVGGTEAGETLRAALAMGADQAILLRAEGGPEGMAVAAALAAELRDRTFDIALFGMKAIDDDLQAVGAMTAELLELPSATVVSRFTVENGRVTAERAIEGGIEVVELKLPCILSITKGAYELRYASLKGIMAAKKKPLEEKPANLGDSGIRETTYSYPPERKPGRIVGTGPDAVPELVRLLREEAKVL